MRSRRTPTEEEAERDRILEMEREPGSAGRRFRLRRRPTRPQPGLPLWARSGLWLRWPVGVVLTVAAMGAALLACALLALAVFLPTVAR